MKNSMLLVFLLILNLLGLILNLVYGSVAIPFAEILDDKWKLIIWESRLPAAVTSLFTGMSLGAAGLLLQSYFRNPLAGPSILGITSGANLVIALLALGSINFFAGYLSPMSMHTITIVGSLVGAMMVLALLLTIGRIVRSQVMLLIVGMLLSYLVSAIITLLGYYASAQGVQQLMLWGMGDFSSIGNDWLFYYVALLSIGLLVSFALIKPLNGWMLGELYATNLGINLKHVRWLVLLTTGWLAAVTTAGCGPIAFVGLATPHIARILTRTDDHRFLLPTTMLTGGLCCELCLWISTLPEGGSLLPINALTPIFGVPVILYVMLKK